MIFDEKSPGSVLSYFQSYPCGNLHFAVGQRVGPTDIDLRFGITQIESVMLPPDVPGAAQLTRSVAMWRFYSPDKYCTRHTVLFGDDVQAPVHSIDEIYVDISCRAKHYFAAFRFAAEGVACWVVLSIGFYLKDASSEYLSAI
jgi:hypothetical protein